MTTPTQGTTTTSDSSTPAGGVVQQGQSAGEKTQQETQQPGTTTTETPGGQAKPEEGNAEGTQGNEGANSQGEQGAPKEGEGQKKDDKAESEFVAKLPDGFAADEATLKEFGQYVKDNGLKGETAQKFVDMHVKSLQRLEQQRLEAMTTQNQQWKEQVTNDKNLGGANWDTTRANMKKVMATFGSQELTEFFKSSPYGSFPPLVAFVAKLGAAMSEDRISGTNQPPATGGKVSEQQVLENRYPSMFPKNE